MNTMIVPQEISSDSIKNSVLFLTLSTFCQTGGIQKVCRTLCKTLSDLKGVDDKLFVLSLRDQTKEVDARYLQPNHFKGFRCNKVLFSTSAFLTGLKVKTIVLSHVHLLPVAILIKLFKPSIKIILLAHGIEIWKLMARWKTAFMQRHLQIWSVSTFTADKLIKTHKIPIDKVLILHNCLDPFFIIPTSFKKPELLLKKYDLDIEQPVLLGINRLDSHEQDKGYDQVIQCIPALLKEFPRLCYLLAGKCEESEHQRLKQIIKTNKLENHVKTVGFITDLELTNHYLLADIFILNSKKEGFGLVLIEASACGRKIVCGNKDGSRDAVLNGQLGRMVDPDNIKQLQDTIAHLLRQQHTDQMAQQLQTTCTKNFDYTQYKMHVKNLLNS
jgi:phosphatidylinositol alpha-1,6-mannosyltransferase